MESSYTQAAIANSTLDYSRSTFVDYKMQTWICMPYTREAPGKGLR